MKILIAGGGIGGLTAALLLHAAGFNDIEVLESVPRIEPLGVGINLLPHSVRILDGLGLLPTLRDRGVETRELIYFNKHGQRIWTEPRGRHAGYDVPQISLSRGVLHMTLLELALRRLGPERVQTSHRVSGFEEQGGEIFVDVSATDGPRRLQGDILVGADGIHSRIRKLLYPTEGEPIYSGRILWRAVSLASPYLSAASMVMIGHRDQKFVAYPIQMPGSDGTQLINWIAELASPRPDEVDWNSKVSIDKFMDPFAEWGFDWLNVPALIRSADAVYEYPLVDRNPLPRWTKGRVTLLGDAAHPMYPIGSNGASQAILDGQALTAALLAEQDPEVALQRYEHERRKTTARIVIANRTDGPEVCMQIAEQRAPHGFTNIDEVIPRHELESIAAKYKAVAGFTPPSNL